MKVLEGHRMHFDAQVEGAVPQIDVAIEHA